MRKVLDFLREQVHISASTNFMTITNVSSAIARKDIIGVSDVVTGEIKSAIKDIAEESSLIKQELKSEFSKKA